MLRHGRYRFLAAAARARSALRQNAVLLFNSGAVTFGNLCTSVLGFAYWWVAARSFPPEAVGIASALVSVMALIGLLGEVGLGTLLIGEPPQQRGRDRGMISAALLVTLAASGLIGLAYVAAAMVWPSLTHGSGGLGAMETLFVTGCALTGVALVFDSALVGLLRAGIQLQRNVAFSILKLLLLAAAAMLLPGVEGALSIMLAWVLGLGLSLLLVGALVRHRGIVAFHRPDFPVLLPKIVRVADHHALDMASQAPTILFPFLVAIIFSPTVNAAFFPAWAIVHAASMFPAALTMVLFRLGNQDADGGAARLGFSLLLSAAFALAAGMALFLFSREILAFFNPAYPGLAGSSLQLLGFGILSLAVRAHYLALMRLRGTMRRASLHFAAWSGFEIATACLGGLLAGLEGFTIGWLLAISAQAASMLPALLRASGLPWSGAKAARGPGPVRLVPAAERPQGCAR